MDIKQMWNEAVSRAIEHADFLEGKAFIRGVRPGGARRWVVHPKVLMRGYSSTEAIVVGTLVELFDQIWGLHEVEIPEDISPGIRLSQEIWWGAPGAAALAMELDNRQRYAIRPLLEPLSCWGRPVRQ